MAAISRLMFYFDSNNICDLLMYTFYFKKPYKKKSGGIKSVEHGGQAYITIKQNHTENGHLNNIIFKS